MVFTKNDVRKNRFFTLLAYITAILAIIPIIFQSINQYIILPYSIKSILNNLILVVLILLSTLLLVIFLIIVPLRLYNKRKIHQMKMKNRDFALTPLHNQTEDKNFANNPINFFMKSLEADELSEDLK